MKQPFPSYLSTGYDPGSQGIFIGKAFIFVDLLSLSLLRSASELRNPKSCSLNVAIRSSQFCRRNPVVVIRSSQFTPAILHYGIWCFQWFAQLPHFLSTNVRVTDFGLAGFSLSLLKHRLKFSLMARHTILTNSRTILTIEIRFHWSYCCRLYLLLSKSVWGEAGQMKI